VRPEITEHREVSRMLERCHVFPLHKYAEPAASTVEYLIGPRMYLALTEHNSNSPPVPGAVAFDGRDQSPR
jgi:hypothetical protein